ncbi:MAG: DUF86 domain-containing protein [Thiotrichales bacterium]|nr:DUF86 domain-containing protein [Thiotrichales bacterium]MBT7315092.1 DUF86 domain-containing protein [Thiotrichales bacterium]
MIDKESRLYDYLDHILVAIERINHYTEDIDEVGFLANELIQDAVIRNIEIIGEASHNIEKGFPDFVSSNSELPLSFAYQMRSTVAHGYFKVDFEIVWKTIQTDLPVFYSQIDASKKWLKGS